MRKKHVILMVIVGLLSFAVAFGLTLVLSPASQRVQPVEDVATTGPAGPETVLGGGDSRVLLPRGRELDELIRQLQYEKAEYKREKARLEQWQRRLEIAQKDLENQARELEDLRMELVVPLTGLKEAMNELRQTRVVIRRQERENLKNMAGVYDKMDPRASSRIFQEMCRNNQMDDAAKLMSFMSDRPVAKVLAEIPDKMLAARLFEKLKNLQEEG